MREGSPNKFSTADPLSGSRTGAKSLFRNILAISPCDSIFCLHPALSPTRKLPRMSILGKEDEKKLGDIHIPTLFAQLRLGRVPAKTDSSRCSE